jgi:hypothetical protein
MITNVNVGNLSQLARGRLRTYLLALPSEIGVSLRWSVGMPVTAAGIRKIERLAEERGDGSITSPAPLDLVYEDAQADVQDLLGIDAPPPPE